MAPEEPEWEFPEDSWDLCACGRETAGEGCIQCGSPLCPMCFECGCGFCDKHPDNEFRPDASDDDELHLRETARALACPWPEHVFPMTDEEYVAAVPDKATRTAISGFLMRKGWEAAVEAILEEGDC